MDDKRLAKAARLADRTVNGFIVLFLLMALLIAGYAWYDTYHVVHASDSFGLTDEHDIYEKMMELREKNPEVIGWVYFEGTGINYPILQGKDDWSYISKDYEGKDNGGGSIFLRQGNSPDFTDWQSILMGHNMNEGRMFGDVPKYKNEDYMNEHYFGKVFLPDRVLKLDAAVFLEASSEDPVIYNVPQVSEESKEALLNDIYSKAIHTRGTPLTTEDQLVTLSTCSLNTLDGRYLLVCRVTGELGVPV